MQIKTLLYCFMLISTLATAQSSKYIIDFEADVPVFNFVSDQVTEVTGNVLLNDATKAQAGFGYKITMTISGGPEGSTPINYLLRDNSGPALATAASKFDVGGTKIREQFGGAAALSFAFLGRESNAGDYTYLRDPSSNLRFTLELDNGEDLENVTYILGDMDYSLENTNPTSTCFGPTDGNNYRCRSTYIDQVTVISGAGTNEYTFANPTRIYHVGKNNVRDNSAASSRQRMGDTFYANFLDANDDQLVDGEDDGKIPGTDGDGNITVYNPGNIGSQIIFDYNDPGFGLADDPDGYHDFDAYNQVMSFMTGMTFGSCEPMLSQVETDIYPGEQACVTVTGVSSYTVSPIIGVSQSGENLCLNPTETTIYTITSIEGGCTDSSQFEVRVWNEAAVPTMSEWGLMIFGLLILNMAVMFVYQQEQVLAGIKITTKK